MTQAVDYPAPAFDSNDISDRSAIVDHYGTSDLTQRVDEALGRAGFGTGVIPLKVLAPLDQFHVRGLEATSELADRLMIQRDQHMLDIGCGLGGPARHLASVYGCLVTGIDLNQPFIDLATMLTQRTGLADRVKHVCADALHLPFEPASFDLAITQHVAMNIADKDGLYSGIYRTLRPGGKLAIYDVIAAGIGALHFPVPWARLPENSFVITAKEMQLALEKAGFAITEWVDQTEVALAWFERQAVKRSTAATLPALGLPLLMGPEFPAMAANLARNLVEKRAHLVQVVAQRPL